MSSNNFFLLKGVLSLQMNINIYIKNLLTHYKLYYLRQFTLKCPATFILYLE